MYCIWWLSGWILLFIKFFHLATPTLSDFLNVKGKFIDCLWFLSLLKWYTCFSVWEFYCTALHCTALYCATLHCTALKCTEMHCTALHCTTLRCTALHFTALHCTALHYTALHGTSLHYLTALHCTALHCTTLHCTALHCREPSSLLRPRACWVTGRMFIWSQGGRPSFGPSWTWLVRQKLNLPVFSRTIVDPISGQTASSFNNLA